MPLGSHERFIERGEKMGQNVSLGTRVRRQREEEREMGGGQDPFFKTSTTNAMVTREVRKKRNECKRKEMTESQNSQRCLRFYQRRCLSG